MALIVAVQRAEPSARPLWIGGLALSTLVLLAGLLWVLPTWLNWSRYRGVIAHFAAQQLGRPVQIDGDIVVRLLPSPLILAGNVRVGDGGDGIVVSAPALRLRLRWGPLLVGRVVPQAVVLRGAAISLPWPLAPATLAADRLAWLATSTARIEAGRLRIGGLSVTDLDADFGSAGQEVGGWSVRGTARALGHAWRFADRLGQTDAGGDAPFEATLQTKADRQQGPAPDMAAHFAGTLHRQGRLSGRLSAQVADLSQLLPAPVVGASAEGTIALGRGPAQADLAVTVGGVGAAAHLLTDAAGSAPVLSLTMGRLDLDPWQSAWTQRASARHARQTLRPDWPVKIDLTISAVGLRGGLARGVHAVLDFDGSMLRLSGSATLPGEAAVSLSASVTNAVPGLALAGEWTLEAPELPTTLGWLAACGLRIPSKVPPNVLRRAALAGHVTASHDHVELSALTGTLEQSRLGGGIGVTPSTGAIDADLTLDHLDIDNWMPHGVPAHWTAVSHALADYALALKLHAGQASWQGFDVQHLVLDAATNAGGLAINKLEFELGQLRGEAGGTIGGDGQVSDGTLDLTAEQGTALAPFMPAWARFAGYLWSGPVHLHAEANGPPGALSTGIGIDLADARLEAHATVNLEASTWSSRMTLRHPGAPRLLGALGLAHGRDWLGEGSLSLLAQLSASPGELRADSLDLTAGGLHATGDLLLAHQEGALPRLTGHVAAETLPLFQLAAHDRTPFPLGWLRGWDAQLDLTAGVITTADAPVVYDASATMTLADGVLRLDVVKAGWANGALNGTASMDTTTVPPRLALTATVAGAIVTDGLFGTPLDLLSGIVDARLRLDAQGYSPAAMLASLDGSAQVGAVAGSLRGLDIVAARRATQAANPRVAVAAAMSHGLSPFDRLDAQASVANGNATLTRLALDGPSGGVQATGTIDLSEGSMSVLADLPDQLDVRFTGAVGAPRRLVQTARTP